MSRTDLVWRRFLLALCVLGVLAVAANVWTGVFWFAETGITAEPSGAPFIDRVEIAPGSSAAAAGLRSGDRVDLRTLSPSDRYRWRNSWTFGEQMRIAVLRSDGTHAIKVVAGRRYEMTWDVWVSEAGVLWMILFAALLAWRRPDSAEARILALILLAIGLGADLDSSNWLSPLPAADAVVGVIGWTIQYAGAALLATYAMLFVRPATLVRRVLAGLSYVSAAVATALIAAGVAALWTLAVDPNGPLFSSHASQFVQSALPWLFPLLCAMVTIGAAHGEQRARIAWATSSLGLYYAAAFFSAILGTEATFALFPSLGGTIGYQVINVIWFIVPIGLTYSVLNRRLLDIGFAVNRAAVFSGVSIVIVGTFFFVEWLLGYVLHDAGHLTNIAVSAVVALALGFSMRAVHTRVDRFVDAVFFRQRHEDEKAIRTFAHEAAYITQREILLQRASDTIERHADASFVTIALDDGAGSYGGVSENDPAIVSLRAGHAMLDLHTVATALRGEFAYPMGARGRLIGALVLGAKRSGESYAPDESDAIAQLAHGVGTALDVLSAKGEDTRDAVLDAVRALTSATAALSEATRALPDAIVERLRRAGV